MVTDQPDIIVTLVATTVLFLLLVAVIITAAARYQNRKRAHLMDVKTLTYEAEQQILKTRLEVQEKTLSDISREIHDNIGQILSVVKLNLHSLKPNEENAIAQLGSTIELVNKALRDLRNLSKVLNAEYITHEPLSSLIQREAEIINQSNAFRLTFELYGDEIEFAPEKKLVLFRMTQECVQNAIKHSKASQISVKLSFNHQEAQLVIEDNGIGFDYEKVRLGNGMTNLRTRSKLIPAQLDVKSALNQGTKITVSFSHI